MICDYNTVFADKQEITYIMYNLNFMQLYLCLYIMYAIRR